MATTQLKYSLQNPEKKTPYFCYNLVKVKHAQMTKNKKESSRRGGKNGKDDRGFVHPSRNHIKIVMGTWSKQQAVAWDPEEQKHRSTTTRERS